MTSLSFDPSVPLWAIVIIFLLTIISLWFESKKKSRFLMGRLVAVGLVGLSLLGVLLKPSYQTLSNEQILLLTPGFKSNQVDSLTIQNPQLKIMHTKECGDIKNSDLIGEDFFETRSRNVLFILGEGLSSSILETMPEKNFKFLPADQQGVTKILLPSQVIQNQKASLKGVLSSESDISVRLIGPSGVEDSVSFEAGSNQLFSLSFTPKQKGKFIYQLEIQDDSQIAKEPVPIDVQEAKSIKILFLQKYPTAETKHLKNFLAESGHSLTLRHQTSRQTFSYEFINAPESRFSSISQKPLTEFDLLFIDIAQLNTLSPNERNELISATQAGLGIIVLQNEESKNLNWFWPLQFKAIIKDTAYVNLTMPKKYMLKTLPIDLASSNETYPVLNSGSRILSGYVLRGNGRIAFSLLQETYRIKMEGNERDYVMIWNSLINKTSRKKSSDQVTITSLFPIYPKEPVDIDILSPDPILLSDTAPIALMEDLSIDGFWHARIWADQPGWHALKTSSSNFNYFVSPTNSWHSIHSARRAFETERVTSNLSLRPRIAIETNPIPQLAFFLIFILASGFLWLAPKLN